MTPAGTISAAIQAAGGARPSDAERRSDRQGRRGLHQLVRPGKLHGWPRLVHHRANSDPLCPVDRGRPGGREPPPQGDADDRRVLQEEWLQHVFLRQVASRRQARSLSDRAWLRRDEEFRCILCWASTRTTIRASGSIPGSIVQSGIREVLRRSREHRTSGRAWPASPRRRSAGSTTTLREPSTSARPTKRSTYIKRHAKAISRSSWTSTSSRCTTRTTQRRSSRAARISATTRTR